MTRLLAADTTLQLLRQHRRVVAHAASYAGQLNLSAATAFEVRLFFYHPNTPSQLVPLAATYYQSFTIREVTREIAHRAADLARRLPVSRRSRAAIPALVAATALEYGLILVTRKPSLYTAFGGLTFEDWSRP